MRGIAAAARLLIPVLAAATLPAGCGKPPPDRVPPPRWSDDLANRAEDPQAAWPPFTVIWNHRGKAPSGTPVPLDYVFERPENLPALARNMGRVVAEAAAIWNRTGLVDIRESGSRDGSDPAAKIRILVAPAEGAAFIPWDGELAHTIRAAGEIRIVLNPLIPFESGGGVPLLPTILHELGHALGLGHSPDPGCVMYGGAGRAYIDLKPPDMAGLRSLYERNGDERSSGDIAILRLPESGSGTGSPLETLACIRKAAPPDRVHMESGDIDGDGIDEILLWSKRDEDHRALWILKFDEQSSLSSTLGPFPAFWDPGFAPSLRQSGDGSLLVAQSSASGATILLGFDRAGIPNRPVQPAAAHRPLPWTDADGRLLWPSPEEPEGGSYTALGTAPGRWRITGPEFGAVEISAASLRFLGAGPGSPPRVAIRR